MFCYDYVVSLSAKCGFDNTVACVIAAHYNAYARVTYACKRRALVEREARLEFAALN